MSYNKPAVKKIIPMGLSGILLIALHFISAGVNDIRLLLPDPSWSDDWKTVYKPEVYSGEDLYLYINGGAEIYQEYGFRQVLVQDYQSRRDNSLSLEIYEMSNPLSAYGIFTFKSGTDSKEADIGWQARLDDYYLNCWKGRYLLTITGFDQEPETLRGLQDLARAVTSKIKPAAPEQIPRPEIMSSLPESGRVPGSVVYFSGSNAFFNRFPLVLEVPVLFEEGIKADYHSGHSLHILKFSDTPAASKSLQSLAESFETKTPGLMHRPDETTLQLSTEKAGVVVFRQHGRFFYCVTHVESLRQALNIIPRREAAWDP